MKKLSDLRAEKLKQIERIIKKTKWRSKKWRKYQMVKEYVLSRSAQELQELGILMEKPNKYIGHLGPQAWDYIRQENNVDKNAMPKDP